MKRRIGFRIAGLLILGLVFLAACVSGPGTAPDTDLLIYHFNDSHARVEEGRYAGMGFAKMASLIDQEKEQGKEVLVLDAGDSFHGQTIATLVEGASIARIMNILGVDAMTAGNHDFNYGQERLLELDQETDYPILSANILKDGKPFLTPYVIEDINGLKIAIFGLTTPETLYKTHPDNVEGLEFADPVEIAADLVPKLRKQAHIVIALSHLGLDESSTDTSRKLAEMVEGIDLIVDGHSHTELPEGMMVGNTLIVQAGEHDKNLGRVELSISDGVVSMSASLIPKDEAADIEPSAAVTAVIDEVNAEINAVTSEVVGESEVFLLGERGDVRTGETNLGDLITDAVLEATGADVVITNGGGIRASIEAGPVTVGDIITVLPFGNYVVTKEISGADILAALEHGIDSYPETKGAFPHIAGMTLRFDGTAAAGSRIIEVKVAGEPLDPDKEYILATNDFMAAGGDDYTMLGDDAIAGEFGGLDEIVIDYIKARGSVSPSVDGRVTAE